MTLEQRWLLRYIYIWQRSPLKYGSYFREKMIVFEGGSLSESTRQAWLYLDWRNRAGRKFLFWLSYQNLFFVFSSVQYLNQAITRYILSIQIHPILCSEIYKRASDANISDFVQLGRPKFFLKKIIRGSQPVVPKILQTVVGLLSRHQPYRTYCPQATFSLINFYVPCHSFLFHGFPRSSHDSQRGIAQTLGTAVVIHLWLAGSDDRPYLYRRYFNAFRTTSAF